MYSFYGGRPGNSFVIVTTYKSVDDMIKEFKKGPEYTAVHYNEYVLINTPNKNDSDNGKIFRRGYDYKNDLGGAEQIGQIVGPAGPAPNLQVKSIGDIDDVQMPQGSVKKPAGNAEEPEQIGSWSISNNGLIPGKYSDENNNSVYNDTINWKSFTIRKSDNSESTAYVGLQIPYPVIEFETSLIEPYDQENKYKDTSDATRIDDGSHPFYEKWHIKIPEGIKGDSFENLYIEKDQNDGFDHLYYKIKKYDENKNGVSIEPVDLGAFNIIKDISINEEGTITISYTGHTQTVFENVIKSINDIQLNNETGNLTISYNHGNDTVLQGAIKRIDDISLSSNGIISVKYNTEEAAQEINPDNGIKWINQLQLTSDGDMLATYNQSIGKIFVQRIEDEETQTSYKESFYIPQNKISEYQARVAADTTGNIWIEETPIVKISTEKIKWITDMRVGDMGVLQVKYNTSDNWENLVDKDEKNISLKFVTNLNLDDEGHLIATYNKPLYYSYQTTDQQGNTIIGRVQVDNKESWEENPDNPELTAVDTEELSSAPLKWITNITQNNTDLIIQYNTKHKVDNETEDGLVGEDIYENDSNIFGNVFNIPTELKLEAGILKVHWREKTNSEADDYYQTLGDVDSVEDVALDSKGNLLFKFASGKGKTEYSKNEEEPKTNWQYIGTIAPGAYGFDSNSINFHDLYILGYLEGRDLHFNLSTSYLLPTTIQTIQINSADEIKYSEDNSLNQIIQSPIETNYIIESNISGFNFTFQNILDVAKENITPVNIYIKNLILGISIDKGGDPDVQIDWQARLEALETLAQKLNATLYPTDQDGNEINKIKNFQTQINDLDSRTTTTKNNLSTIQGYMGVLPSNSTFSATTYGGTTVLSSLAALKKPAKRILTLRNASNGDSKKKYYPNLTKNSMAKNEVGRYMHTPGFTETQQKNGKSWSDFQNQDYQQIILTGEDRLSQQQHGYILEWQQSSTTSQNDILNAQHMFFFIPKDFRATGWQGIAIPLIGARSSWGLKYIYIREKNITVYSKNTENKTETVSATQIHGHYNNNQEITYNGITFKNSAYALTAIYGV